MSDGGLKSFQKRMRAIPQAARNAVQPALVKSAEEIAALQRAMAPDDPKTSAPDLKSSIAVTGPGQTTPPYSQPGGSMVVPENMAAITAGNTDVRYPHLQEYGTTFHAAQPFFWPGFRLGRKRALDRIKRSIGKAIREAK
ncbi:HK97-gp10 family putative phage morphogenesis protein [Paracoccus sp. MC1862]|uniref:HK97-gp10 family putative phage morphogenesis protein n=1 Tax=Paracoccus sp. MC1862 TaxID=2760307 RepID=UPI00160494D3|nr:HK97-gp10 family putative phage morphogenesis protein [Paracoccus sp. MC1862]MBB1498465.1 HK97 gp10 family phage protein [Paracoccus sp. MC1862]QQO43817.1 HK97 gp10 family phage protein [Paracoccus sp. MC1862]